jgi:hypothetical protein
LLNRRLVGANLCRYGVIRGFRLIELLLAHDAGRHETSGAFVVKLVLLQRGLVLCEICLG